MDEREPIEKKGVQSWQVNAGSEIGANFPVPIKNKYIRLIVSPIGSTSVKVNELRFIRIGTFEEIQVDLIKNLNWDSGDEKFYLDANATGLVSGETGNDPVLWAADGGIGGTRDAPLVKLTPDGLQAKDGTGYRVSGSGEVSGPGPDGSWYIVDQMYLKNWTTTINFSSNARDDIQWTSGDIIFGNGTTLTMDSGSHTISSGKSAYIYVDRSVSDTVLQVSEDFSDLVQPGIALICRGVYNSDSTQNAMVIGESVTGLQITSTNIGTNSISTGALQANCVRANEMQANTITATEMSSSNVSGIFASFGTMEAGLIQNSAGTVKFDLTNGLITVNKTGGLVLSGSDGMTVTGDINVTTGNIKIGENGDVVFSGAGKINSTIGTTDYLNIHPDGTGTKHLLMGGVVSNIWDNIYPGKK